MKKLRKDSRPLFFGDSNSPTNSDVDWAVGSTRRSLVYSADNDLDNSGQDEGMRDRKINFSQGHW